MAPHLAGTGCFETGTPTLTSFSVKIAEVYTDVTGGLQAYHIHPPIGCGVSWERPEQHRQRSRSFPSTERTCGQTLLTIQFPLNSHCIPHARQMLWILGLLRPLHHLVCPRVWPRVLRVVRLWHSSILWADHSVTSTTYQYCHFAVRLFLLAFRLLQACLLRNCVRVRGLLLIAPTVLWRGQAAGRKEVTYS